MTDEDMIIPSKVSESIMSILERQEMSIKQISTHKNLTANAYQRYFDLSVRRNRKFICTYNSMPIKKIFLSHSINKTDATNVANAFVKKFIRTFGAPTIIWTDREIYFMSSLIEEITKLFEIKFYRITGYRLQSNWSIKSSRHVLKEYVGTNNGRNNKL